MAKAVLIWLLLSIGGILGAVVPIMIILNCAGTGCETAIIWALPIGILIGAVSFVIIGVLINSFIK